MKKKAVGFLMAAVMVLGLAACSSGASEPEEVSSTETTAEGESNTDAQGSTGLKIGLAVQTLSNQVWAQQAERIQQDAEADGNEVTVVDCKENANTQIDQLENFISSGVDAIIVNPVDAAAIEEVCKEAREAGVLVMSWDEEMENSDINWLIDNYVRAEDSEKLVDLADISFLDLIDTQGDEAINSLPKKIKQNERSVAEILAANMRKMIISERPNNPAYFDKMSDLLNHLLQEQKDGKIQYKELIKKLIEKLKEARSTIKAKYPATIDTKGKQALYDNLGKDETLALRVHETIKANARDGFRDMDSSGLKKMKALRRAVEHVLQGLEVNIDDIMQLIVAQREY